MKPFQPNGAFYPIAAESGLRRAAVRGAGAAIAGQTANFLVGMGSIVVLGRLLAPADFGVVTMVTTFSLLFRSFGQNGFTELIVQRDEVTDALASNLFWINSGIGLALTVFFAASGHLLAAFYHDALVAKVAEGISLTIAIGCLGYIHLALLQRAMHFRSTALIGLIGQVIQVVVSVIAAMLGAHYWALVWGSIAQTAALTVGGWIVCRWIPKWPRKVEGTGSSFRFAMNVYSHYAFSYLTNNTDNLLVGWRFGARSLGFYKKAYDLFILPETQLMAPLSSVVVGVLSRVNRDRQQFERVFLRILSVLTLVGMAVGTDFALVGRDFFRILLGPGWEEAGRIFALFGPGIGLMLLNGTHGWIHLSIGRPERWFRWGLFEFACTTALFLIALPWGPAGIAFAWTASLFLLTLPGLSYAGKPIGLRIGPIVSVIWKYLVAALAASAATLWILRGLGSPAPLEDLHAAFLAVLSKSAVFVLLYCCGVIILNRGAGPLLDSVSLLRELLPSREAAPSAADAVNKA